MNYFYAQVAHPSWLRQRELGKKCPLGYSDRFSKSLYAAMYPCYSWDQGGTIRSAVHGGIMNLEFSPDGSFLVAACEKNGFLIFDSLRRKMMHYVKNAHKNCVTNVKFLDFWTFATGGKDSTVALWDTRNLKTHIRSLQVHSNSVQDIQYSPRDGLLVTSGFDGSVCTWNINNYTEEDLCNKVFYTHDLMRMRLTPDATKMIMSTARGYLMIIHNLNLSLLTRDLNGFQPDEYLTRLRQTNPEEPESSVPLHLRRRRNRVELVTDFPKEGDTNVISSLEIHPQGRGALTRTTSELKGLEWTCFHDVQEFVAEDFDSDMESESEDIVSAEPSGRPAAGGVEEAEGNPGSPAADADKAAGEEALAGEQGEAGLGEPERGHGAQEEKEKMVEKEEEKRAGGRDKAEGDEGKMDSSGNTILSTSLHSDHSYRALNEHRMSDESTISNIISSSGDSEDSMPILHRMLLPVDPDRVSTTEGGSRHGDEAQVHWQAATAQAQSLASAPAAAGGSRGGHEGQAVVPAGGKGSGGYSTSGAQQGECSGILAVTTSSRGTENLIMNIDDSIRVSAPETNFRSFNGRSNSSAVVGLDYSCLPNLNSRIYQNHPRLTHFLEELNAGIWYIRELCFSPDGRLIVSPFGCGVRLLAFSPGCSEISVFAPYREPVSFHEMSINICHNSVVLSTEFSPRHCLFVSGCFSGNVIWHQPVM